MLIERGGWRCVDGEERDGDGFWTRTWEAQRGAEVRPILHSRFGFLMTPARFGFLVDHDFPPPPRHPGYWTNEAIDAAMGAA